MLHKYIMDTFISPQGRKHCVINTLNIEVNSDLEYAKSMERMGLPILVYFVLAVPTKDWKSWIRNIVIRCKNIYHTIHIVLQCRTWNLSNEDKTLLALIPKNCEIHIFNDQHSSSVQDQGLYGGQSHDPYYGEYRGFFILHKIAVENPDKIIAYGHSKGISHFNNFQECFNNSQRIKKCMILLENTERAKDIFSFIPNVNSVGWYSCSSIENGRTRAHWWNFFFARASFIIQCGTQKKETYRYYYEGHYLLGNNTVNNLAYDMRPCGCEMGKDCSHCDVNEPFFSNIGFDYYPGDDSLKKN